MNWQSAPTHQCISHLISELKQLSRESLTGCKSSWFFFFFFTVSLPMFKHCLIISCPWVQLVPDAILYEPWIAQIIFWIIVQKHNKMKLTWWQAISCPCKYLQNQKEKNKKTQHSSAYYRQCNHQDKSHIYTSDCTKN